MVGREDRSQEDREQAGEAEQDPVEELAVAMALLVGERLPELDRRDALGSQLDDERDRAAGLDADAEDVRAVVLDALGNKALGLRDSLDAARIEIGPDHAGARGGIAVGGQPPLNGLVRRIAQREHEPARVGAGCRGAHVHAEGAAGRVRRRLGLDAVAAAFVQLTMAGDVDPLGILGDLDRLERQCMRRAGGQSDKRGEQQGDERKDSARGGRATNPVAASASPLAHAPQHHAFQSSSIKAKRT